MDIESSGAREEGRRLPVASVALIAAAALAYEILLTRIFAIVHWHHFAYSMISLALLGFGVSGTLLALLRPWALRQFTGVYVTSLWLFGVLAVLCASVAQRLPFHAEELLWDPWQPMWLLLIYLVLALPFFFAATAIGLALTRHRERAGRIYAADLVGAGLGSLCLLALLYVLFPEAALRSVGIAGVAAAAVGAVELSARRVRWFVIAVVSSIFLATLPARWLTPTPSTYKGLSQALRVAGTRIVTVRSSPLGEISVTASPQLPLRYAPGLSLNASIEPPAQLGLFRDGDNMDAITNASTSASASTISSDQSRLAFLRESTAALPYAIASPRAVLVLGAGGGMEVLRALSFDAHSIDAVELDGEVVRLLRNDFDGFSGNLLRRPGVSVHVADARGFLARVPRRFDLIQLSLLGSAGGGTGGLGGLNEDYLHTVEALRLSLDRLQSGGFLALTRWVQVPPRDSLKLFATVVAALEARGVPEPGDHLLMIRSWQTITLLVKNEPVSEQEIRKLRAFCDRWSFDPVWFPGIRSDEVNRYNIVDQPLDYEGARAIIGPARAKFFRDYKFDVRPATDDRPYFQNFFKWATLGEVLDARGRGGMALLEAGYLVLLATLAQATLAGVVLIVLPLAVLRRQRTLSGAPWLRVIVYFTAIGLAFLFIEIAFLQKLIRFLQHPTIALATVLAGFLIFAGLGSAWTTGGRTGLPPAKPARTLRHAVAAIIAIGAVYALGFDALLESALHWPLAARAALATALIAPLAFAMGMPLPLALARLDQPLVPWAWGINACASVLSAPLATMIAIHFGFRVVLWLALGLYGLTLAARPMGDR